MNKDVNGVHCNRVISIFSNIKSNTYFTRSFFLKPHKDTFITRRIFNVDSVMRKSCVLELSIKLCLSINMTIKH